MEKFGLLFLVYMAGIATPFILLVILWAMKGENLTFREFLNGRKDE